MTEAKENLVCPNRNEKGMCTEENRYCAFPSCEPYFLRLAGPRPTTVPAPTGVAAETPRREPTTPPESTMTSLSKDQSTHVNQKHQDESSIVAIATKVIEGLRAELESMRRCFDAADRERAVLYKRIEHMDEMLKIDNPEAFRAWIDKVSPLVTIKIRGPGDIPPPQVFSALRAWPIMGAHWPANISLNPHPRFREYWISSNQEPSEMDQLISKQHGWTILEIRKAVP